MMKTFTCLTPTIVMVPTTKGDTKVTVTTLQVSLLISSRLPSQLACLSVRFPDRFVCYVKRKPEVDDASGNFLSNVFGQCCYRSNWSVHHYHTFSSRHISSIILLENYDPVLLLPSYTARKVVLCFISFTEKHWHTEKHL